MNRMFLDFPGAQDVLRSSFLFRSMLRVCGGLMVSVLVSGIEP